MSAQSNIHFYLNWAKDARPPPRGQPRLTSARWNELPRGPFLPSPLSKT
jgi:hypothetical protein